MTLKVVVLTGAGMSAESGLRTFRDSGGLWEGHRVEEVATPQAWRVNPAVVQRFYNERRRALAQCAPNAGHLALAEAQARFDVRVVTQNVDDLHERAGSRSVLHLHGELTKARSDRDEDYVLDIGYRDLSLDERCPRGGRLRPHIVWFGEAVPAMDEAVSIVSGADVVLVVGTSLQVYPAASLITYAPAGSTVVVIDPVKPQLLDDGRYADGQGLQFIQAPASTGVPEFLRTL
jgi:NAD-dependent deacetylase